MDAATVLFGATAFFCLPLSILGIRSVFLPDTQAPAMFITAQGAAGKNTVRGVIGGFFFACVSMLALGLATGEPTWLLAVAVLMAAVLFGRFVGLLRDGFDKAVVPPIVVEFLILGVVLGKAFSP